MTISRDEICWYYRAILGREPDSDAAIQAHMNKPSLSSLRKALLCSPEFIGKWSELSPSTLRPSFFPLDLPTHHVEYEATEAQLRQCIAKVRELWAHLGDTRPHHSVLTNSAFLPENIDGNIEKFWASGDAAAAKVERVLARHGFTSLSTKTCVEYGCGVGRVTTGLARRFSEVHAYDVSAGHLVLAEGRAQEVGAPNCRFHLCSDNPLEALEACDVFYSIIVFQHNPPPLIYQLIRNALRALSPGGIAIFQVPTFSSGYGYSIDKWLATDHGFSIQMHCLPQHVIFSTIFDEHCVPLDVREDDSAGPKFLSNTFVVRKEIRISPRKALGS